MILRKALRSKTSFCRVCGKYFQRGEKYVKLNGSYRIMRSIMCIDHFKLKDCKDCMSRLNCLTKEKQTICILGNDSVTKVEEL